MEIALQFPARSLGEVAADGQECVLTVANVTVISASRAQDSHPSLPSITDRISFEHNCETPAVSFGLDLIPQEQVQHLVLETVRLVFKQLAEKLDAVRDVAGKILENLVGSSDPTIGYVVDRQRIVRCFGDMTTAIQNIEARKSNDGNCF